MSKRIVVFGATSGIGKLAVDEALERGHSVRAFARSAGEMAPRDGLELCPGDALQPDDVARAIAGMEAVVYCLGIEESVSMLWKEVTLFSDSTRVLLAQMAASDVQRLIVVTGFGAGRSKSAMSFIERAGHRAILGKPYEDKDRQEELLMQSDVDWTIVRPVILRNNAKTGQFKVLRDPSEWRNGLISRADVAVYLINAAEEALDIRADVVLAR
ncbi:NAD(P)-dependent oxidoreductase [Cognatishimia sp. MH4019]|uniref:NAD(P)-dependent oxidoreductase n=1 Tax=Cognatishimia sp. MH4019 TaxID=2854030 RepID=UPI001CD7694E|nr:NAD(P)H-binding protein [Cognatishimia sp. MH4019]